MNCKQHRRPPRALAVRATTALVIAALHGIALAQTLPAPPASPRPIVNYEYDAEGNPTKTVQAPGVSGFDLTSKASYDSLDRAKDTTDARNKQTLYGYDGLDRLTRVTDPRALVTQYPRNGLGDQDKLISPDTGTTTYTYYDDGSLKTALDSRGVLATYTYDALNRLKSIVYSQSGQPSRTYSWTYDQTGTGFSYGIGRLTTSSFPAGTQTYAYDPLGRLASTTQQVVATGGANASPLSHTLAYGYTAGQLTSRTYPSGRVVTYTYTGGQISALSVKANSGAAAQTLLSQIHWQPFGGVDHWLWQMASGTQAYDRSYDDSGRIVRYTLGGVVRDLRYDAAGRITSYTHLAKADGAAQPNLDQSFGYDELGRVKTVNAYGYSWTIGYDDNGNRTSVTINGSTRAYTTAANSNRLTSISNPARNFGYDAVGNTTSDNGLGYTTTYFLENRLWSVSRGGATVNFSYNDQGQRIRKFSTTGASSTVVFVYDALNGNLLGEYDSTGQAIKEYVWLGSIPVAVLTPDPANAANPPLVYYIQTDHLNTPRIVIDRNDKRRWRWLAEAFGTTAPETNPDGLGVFAFNLRFPGQYFDQETGLNYNWHRDYDPSTGRYVQSDPIGLAGGSISTYGYVTGNPVNYFDPNGLENRKYVDLGVGYKGGIDIFEQARGADFEIHVFDPKGQEVGLFGPDGWFNKHGHKGAPKMCPTRVENQLKGNAIEVMRRTGELPPKGNFNIKGNRWMRSVRGVRALGPISTAIHILNFKGCRSNDSAACMCELENDVLGGNPETCTNPCADPESDLCV